jgi:hypothetical protein
MDRDDRRRAGDRVQPIPPNADPAEAVERIVPRRHLLFEDGDVLIVRTSATLRPAELQSVYELRIRGLGGIGERFASFEHAVARGDQLATARRVRLMYVEAPDDPPHLLKDYRPKR